MPKKKKNEITIRSSAAEYLTYVASVGGGESSVEMRYEDENIWLTQKMMATLYDVSVPTINEHIKRIYSDGELTEVSTIRKFRIVQDEGERQVNREVIHYNLQMIIAVGFKVNNDRAVQFRKWAGQIVKDYTIQGWTMDVERLKKGTMFTDEYFDRQLENIREIRLSERKFYQKVTDLYATAFDYDKDSHTTKLFFQTVQNKLHYATHRHTAAELIVERADAEKEHMGLTSWENAPDGKIVKSDVSIAKNYLTEKELSFLERIVSLYLDYAEFQAERHIPMSMEDWAKLNRNSRNTVSFRTGSFSRILTSICWSLRSRQRAFHGKNQIRAATKLNNAFKFKGCSEAYGERRKRSLRGSDYNHYSLSLGI